MIDFQPRNILIINFGQLGDVVLSLPAVEAVRKRFPNARLTVMAGKAASAIVVASGFADEVITVDRVALRDGLKVVSAVRIGLLVREVRRRKFDFVIDLHSLPETNMLGFVSGAKRRLYAERITRSLDFLANFPVRPPRYDLSKHVIERYLDVLSPLGINSELREPRLRLMPEDEAAVEAILKKKKLMAGKFDDVPLIGLFTGAGNASRQWHEHRFAELANKLKRDLEVKVVLIIGPEEQARAKELALLFGDDATLIDKLTLGQLAALMARLSVFVSNDTGPVHIAAAVGTPVVVLLDRTFTNGFQPVGVNHRIVFSQSLDDLTVEEVFINVRAALTASRTAALFNR